MVFKKIIQASFFILCTLSLSAAMAEPIARMSDKGVKELGKTIAKQEKPLTRHCPPSSRKVFCVVQLGS